LLVAYDSHLFKAFQRSGLVREVEPAPLESREDYHRRQLMDAYLPDETLEVFLHQDRERTVPAPPLPSKCEQDGPESVADDDSFAAYLRAVRGDVSPALIGEEAMDAIADIARLLPGALALQTFGFECNLSHAEAAGDFLLSVQARAGRSELSAGMPAALRDDPIWRRTQTFLDAWGDAQCVLSSTIDHVWLEFDVSTAAGEPPIPSVFHGYQVADAEDAGVLAPPIDQQIEASRQAFEILTDRPLAPAVLKQLRSCSELLPSGGHVFQLGAMIARDTDAFRVCVTFLDRSQILPYLDRLGWAGERFRLQNLLGQLEGMVDRLALDLDVTRSVLPKIGLECYLSWNDGARGQGWSRFLDFLVDSDIALEPKCKALLCYPGLLDFRVDGARWPASLRRASEFFGSAAISVFLRSIHHVKLVVEPGQPIEAKAYLAARHMWITPEVVARTT
jgi:hypothetical protein